jgi:two-component system, sensor histidine kinase and response regulator
MGQKREITWIGMPGAKAQKSALALSKELEAQSFHSTWLELPADSHPTADWWKQTLSPETRYVFLIDQSVDLVKDLATHLRKSELTGKAPFVIAWVCESLQSEQLKLILDSPVDEIVSASEPAKELSARLEIRLRQVEETLKLQQFMKDRATHEAKQETTIKQREEFLSVCAHDLRSPLGLIQSSLGMILNSKPTLSELHVELLSRAKRQAGQAITLVNDLLDVMSFEQGLKPAYSLFKLDELLKEFYKDYSFQAEQKKIQFHYENPLNDWRVLADPERIRQLLQNLFMNALKFTESNKNIYLSVMPFQGRRKSDPPYPMMVVSLRDEGRGIPEKEMQKIFDRFTQIKDYSRAEGRGLGLTVAKQISTLHDGNIWVQSVEGQGSTFFVLFPHVVSRTEPEKTSATKKKKLLAIVPKESDREKYYEILGRWGYDVYFVKDGIEAVTYSFYHMPHALIVTPDLAKINEFDVYTILRKEKQTATLPIICVSETKLETIHGVEETFYDEFVKLPLNKEAFQQAIDTALQKLTEKSKKAA